MRGFVWAASRDPFGVFLNHRVNIWDVKNPSIHHSVFTFWAFVSSRHFGVFFRFFYFFPHPHLNILTNPPPYLHRVHAWRGVVYGPIQIGTQRR